MLRDGGSDAELSDLGRPENRFERDLGGDLLEVYTRVRSPEGEPLLFEAYLGVDDIRASRAQILDRFLPITIGALIALVALGTPLVLLLSRRLSRAARERERLLEAAVRASDAERLRIARDLHDGVVQDLSGSSMALSALAAHADEPDRRELEDVGRSLRVSVRSLRSLLVEIYPPDLHTAGLAAAVDDLVAPLVAIGTTVDVDVSGADGASRPAVALLWRVAQESVRNVARHARADRMSLTVRHEDDRLVLEVVDDGVGFDPGHRGDRRPLRPARSREPRARARRHLGGRVRAGLGHDGPGGGAGRMIRVVVADDHAVVRRGLTGLIESTDDLEVVGVARDGSEAVDLVREHRPDVAVMDLQMPVLDGVEATRAIVGEATGTEVLVLTSFSDFARIDAAIEAGAVGYLLKDAEPEVLLDGIRAVARGGSPLDPRAARRLLSRRSTVSRSRVRGRRGPALSPREAEVLRLVVEGLLNKQIAQRLGITERTVKAHLTSAYQRIGVADRTQAALWAQRHHLGGSATGSG